MTSGWHQRRHSRQLGATKFKAGRGRALPFSPVDKPKVTIFFTTDFTSCPVKVEATLLKFAVTSYAQYDNVPYVKFIQKGKRHISHHYGKGYHQFLVVIKGWGHPNPPSMFSPSYTSEYGSTCSKSKYLSHDEQYYYDFNRWFNSIKDEVTVIADYRWTKEVK